MPFSKLYILTELSANDVKFISVDRQKLDLSKYIYLIVSIHCAPEMSEIDCIGRIESFWPIFVRGCLVFSHVFL